MTEHTGKGREDISEKHRVTVPMLINQLSRMFDEWMRNETALDAGCMTQNSCRFILRYLAHHTSATQQELTEVARMKAPTISLAIKKMESEGLICRVPDEKDGRCLRVSLTDAGRAYDSRVRQCLDNLDTLMMQGVSAEEEEILLRVMLRMRENIRPEKEKREAEHKAEPGREKGKNQI